MNIFRKNALKYVLHTLTRIGVEDTTDEEIIVLMGDGLAANVQDRAINAKDYIQSLSSETGGANWLGLPTAGDLVKNRPDIYNYIGAGSWSTGTAFNVEGELLNTDSSDISNVVYDLSTTDMSLSGSCYVQFNVRARVEKTTVNEPVTTTNEHIDFTIIGNTSVHQEEVPSGSTSAVSKYSEIYPQQTGTIATELSEENKIRCSFTIAPIIEEAVSTPDVYTILPRIDINCVPIPITLEGVDYTIAIKQIAFKCQLNKI